MTFPFAAHAEFPVVIDLQGYPFVESPNKIVPLWGTLRGIKQVNLPVLELHRTSAAFSKGTILLFPGGGYQGLAVEHEGRNVADFLNRLGYDVAILEYSVADPDARSKALAEAVEAADLLRKQGALLGLNTTSQGIMGFSAGGHLAARLVHEEGALHPFSEIILIYPAYLEASEGDSGGKQLKQEVVLPKGITSRVFVLIGDQDQPEWKASAKAYADTSRENGQKADFHLLPGVGHGFGIQGGAGNSSGGWTDLLVNFLEKE
jgi:acetyl esterase/lipase